MAIVKERIVIKDKDQPIRNQIIEKKIGDLIEIRNSNELKELIKVIVLVTLLSGIKRKYYDKRYG